MRRGGQVTPAFYTAGSLHQTRHYPPSCLPHLPQPVVGQLLRLLPGRLREVELQRVRSLAMKGRGGGKHVASA